MSFLDEEDYSENPRWRTEEEYTDEDYEICTQKKINEIRGK